jgi:hypothetical protein
MKTFENIFQEVDRRKTKYVKGEERRSCVREVVCWSPQGDPSSVILSMVL